MTAGFLFTSPLYFMKLPGWVEYTFPCSIFTVMAIASFLSGLFTIVLPYEVALLFLGIAGPDLWKLRIGDFSRYDGNVDFIILMEFSVRCDRCGEAVGF
ncbi:hypothetical protein [Flavihumibacter fluvii]|uniref:hypothetical protein n=1 Tax=Flavihumibacter fluvii TaxID=2838157 RepID=UPI001BDF6D0D|nr:hypothetical protein [Flavihumibacter fluvii]ULQ51698.1 hypothetical protein KJS93_16530 [Flavihumibacter fluvii]